MAAIAEGGKTPFHVVHKLPAGDGLYFRAKHAQLVEKNPEKAISLFRASLGAGDRVDSALKDLAVALKQLNRPDDAILAISAFRSRCSESAQDSLDNLLLDLYKSCGRLDDQIALLNRKLRALELNHSFNGKRTKTARSQGKRFQVSVDQEVARLLGNLAWAYMQQSNYKDAESAFRRALALEVDGNKVCNLIVCLIKQGKVGEAIPVLQEAFLSSRKKASPYCHLKSHEQPEDPMNQASTLPSLTESTRKSQKRSCAAAEANSLQAGVKIHRHCNRAGNNRRYETNLSSFCKVSNLTDVHTSTSKIVNNGSQRTLACSNEQLYWGSALEHEVIDNQESNNHRNGGNIHEGSHFPMQSPSPRGAYLKMFQTDAQRRLPVFQDIITILGNATA